MNLNYDFRYFPAAKKDFIEAKSWYAKISVDLGTRFSLAVTNAFSNIKAHPQAYTIRYDNIRIAHPDSFPYNIHFCIQNETIIIIAILHNKRNPDIAITRTT